MSESKVREKNGYSFKTKPKKMMRKYSWFNSVNSEGMKGGTVIAASEKRARELMKSNGFLLCDDLPPCEIEDFIEI